MVARTNPSGSLRGLCHDGISYPAGSCDPPWSQSSQVGKRGRRFCQGGQTRQRFPQPSLESAAVRAAEQTSSQLIGALTGADEKWTLYRLLYQDNKRKRASSTSRRFAPDICCPPWKKAAKLHQRDKLVYTLAVLYADKENSLGGLVNTQPGEFALTIGIPKASSATTCILRRAVERQPDRT